MKERERQRQRKRQIHVIETFYLYGTNTQKLHHAERISPYMKERERQRQIHVKETFYLWP